MRVRPHAWVLKRDEAPFDGLQLWDDRCRARVLILVFSFGDLERAMADFSYIVHLALCQSAYRAHQVQERKRNIRAL